MPIKNLRPRLVQVGKIRVGQQVPSRRNAGKMEPASLDTFRVTSPAEHLVRAVAERYGGQVGTWQAPDGPEFEVITAASFLPVWVPPQVIDPWYEAWRGGTLQRRCDGETESLRRCACMCAAQAAAQRYDGPDEHMPRLCRPTTRFMVYLDGVPGTGVWGVESHGRQTAEFFLGVNDLTSKLPDGVSMPARLAVVRKTGNKIGVDDRGNERVIPRDYVLIQLYIDSVTAQELQAGGDALRQALTDAAEAAIGTGTPQAALPAGPQPDPDDADPKVDWDTEIATADGVDQLRAVWGACSRARQLTEGRKSAINRRVAQLQQPTDDPADQDEPEIEGGDPPAEPDPAAPATPTEPDPEADRLYNTIATRAGNLGWTTTEMNTKIKAHAGAGKISEVTAAQLQAFLDEM